MHCQYLVVNGLIDPKTEQTTVAAFYVSAKLNAEN